MYRSFRSSRCAVLVIVTTIGCSFSPEDVDNPRTAWGTLVHDGKSVNLPYALAFRADQEGTPTLAVFLSEQPVLPEVISRRMRWDKQGLAGVWVKQPHVLFAVDEQGKITFLNCGGTHYFQIADEHITAAVHLENNRVTGRARFKDRHDANRRSFNVKFDSPLIDWGSIDAICGELKKFGVSGSLTVNDQEVKLTCASARDTTRNITPGGVRTTYAVVLTEKDHSGLERAERKVLNGKYGAAVVINCFQDGTVKDAAVRHPAFGNNVIKSEDLVTFKDLSFGGFAVEGQLTSGGIVELNGDKVNLRAKFAVEEGTPEFAYE